MEQFTEIFGGGLGLVLIVVGIVWGLLLLAVPFMVFSISSTAKRIETLLIQINHRQKTAQINDLD